MLRSNDIAFDPLLRLPYTLRSVDLLYSLASPEIIVADRLKGFYYKLNEAASDVFRMLAEGASVDIILNASTKKYVAPARSMRVSVMILMAKLKTLDLIAQAGPFDHHLQATTSFHARPDPL